LKALLLDIETSPNTAYVWGLWKENIPLARLIESSEVMCWSAKWIRDDVIMFDSIMNSSPQDMLSRIHELLDEADVVLHYNGSQFDIPCLNKEFLIYGMLPPAPYKQIDLLKTARSQFRFTSNKLDYIAQKLGLGQKKETTFQLWVDCMNYNPEAWKIMEDYNKHDVVLLEKLYERFKPWIKPHPNYTLYTEDNNVMCPVCGSYAYHKRGFAYTAVGKYQRYNCTKCGAWFKDRVNLGYKQVTLV
jgi:DNA polymerase elongation subunit (family B)